jgi:hypothetical protein
MHSIDVALRRSASDAFGVPARMLLSPQLLARPTLTRHIFTRQGLTLQGLSRGPLDAVRRLVVQRLTLGLVVVMMAQLMGGVLADPSRALAPMMSAAATVTSTVDSAVNSAMHSAVTASTAASVAATASAAAARQAIAVAAHVDSAERDAAVALLDSARTVPAAAASPRTVDRILDAAIPASRVATWWSALTTPERDAILAASPTLVGNLDGIPLDARVAANRELASQRLAAYPRTSSQLASAEAAYLARVASGTVSLYAFDVARDSIVEMIGDPSTATRTMVFTPGTTATLADFYSGAIQSFATWQVENAAAAHSTVAFVYKEGTFPQWTVSDGPLDNRRSIELGVLFDRFNDGLDSTVVGALSRTSVEHSFGSSVGGVAEVLGTHFDTRIVLGGVGMVAGWEPAADTRYVAYVAGNDVTRYIYGLVRGNSVGFAVAPSAANGFEQEDPALTSDSWYIPLRLLAGAVSPVVEVVEGFINHNRVASATGNAIVLESILDDIAAAGTGDVERDAGDPPASPTPHTDQLFLPPRESQHEV